MWSELFWNYLKNLKRSLMLQWYIKGFLSRSEAFSRVLSCCERLLNVLKCSLIFWDVLEHLEDLSLVFSGCRKFLKVLMHSLMICIFFQWFWGVVIDSKRFLEVLRHSLTFWVVKSSTDAFQWIMKILERLWSVQSVPCFSRIVRNVLVGVENFLNVLWHSLTFKCDLKQSKMF